jgi:hypothetical protein
MLLCKCFESSMTNANTNRFIKSIFVIVWMLREPQHDMMLILTVLLTVFLSRCHAEALEAL